MRDENDPRSAEDLSRLQSLSSAEVGVLGSVGYEVSIFGTGGCISVEIGYVGVSDDQIQVLWSIHT